MIEARVRELFERRERIATALKKADTALDRAVTELSREHGYRCTLRREAARRIVFPDAS